MRIKKFGCLLFVVLLINSTLAQRFRAGLTAAFVTTEVAGANPSGVVHFQKLGYAFGGLVNTKINTKNMFQFEINYITKGSQQRPDSANNGYYRLEFDYIEVPLIWRHHMSFTIFKKPVSKFDFEAGVSVGRLVRNLYISSDNYPQAIDIKNYNQTDVSILFGLDYNFTTHWCLSLRYSNSVIPVTKRNPAPGPALVYLPVTFNQGNNLVFQFAIKYIFGTGDLITPIPAAE